ncbi:hypothetical protein JTB14_027116 [Gonioctena quinquepunctata]|nr:hypothetical protein JTB14_027116 [Gonioctena quinquepunctata]
MKLDKMIGIEWKQLSIRFLPSDKTQFTAVSSKQCTATYSRAMYRSSFHFSDVKRREWPLIARSIEFLPAEESIRILFHRLGSFPPHHAPISILIFIQLIREALAKATYFIRVKY